MGGYGISFLHTSWKKGKKNITCMFPAAKTLAVVLSITTTTTPITPKQTTTRPTTTPPTSPTTLYLHISRSKDTWDVGAGAVYY
jgi:hypothetical protein